MRKILAIAHSYYMLLTLIQLRETALKNDRVDILLSDASTGSEKVFENLKKAEIFDHCFYYKITDISWPKKATAPEKIGKLLKGTFFSRRLIQQLGIDTQYDVLLVYVANKFEEQIIFNALKKKNPQITCELYEEGYISYFSIFGFFEVYNNRYLKYISKAMTLFGKKNTLIENNISRAWYFNPEMVQYPCDFEICAIPKFNSENTGITELMNRVFGYADAPNIPQKIVFLEGCSFTDGHQTDDLEILNFIAEKTGTDNIAVKLHPRTRTDRFKDLGYNTAIPNVPLELMALNGGNKGKIFLTIESGSPLSCLTNFESDNRVLLLFKCSKFNDAQAMNPKFLAYLQMVERKCGAKQLLIPESMDELREYAGLLQRELTHPQDEPDGSARSPERQICET